MVLICWCDCDIQCFSYAKFSSHYYHSQIVEDYENYMVQIVKLLGYNCENVADEVKEIIEFEKTLAKVSILYDMLW